MEIKIFSSILLKKCKYSLWALEAWGVWGWACSGSTFTARQSRLPGIWWMAKLYWSTHTPQLARMAPSSHPGHGDGHTLGNGIGLPAKLRAGSQIPSLKGYNIFPCSVFPQWTKSNPSTAVAVFRGDGGPGEAERANPSSSGFSIGYGNIYKYCYRHHCTITGRGGGGRICSIKPIRSIEHVDVLYLLALI